MGVRLQDAEWVAGDATAVEPVQPSPEAKACRQAFASVLASAAALAAVSSNLERLSLEYRRSVRRARALQDVMLPELDDTLNDIENRLEELEQEDAVCMRQGADL
jgi:V/A-type H+-transporting ATPase subunit D